MNEMKKRDAFKVKLSVFLLNAFIIATLVGGLTSGFKLIGTGGQ
ncbi:hypothetical protein [Radiobacillus kanasensis]|nr:hypothetical protein [Radiobacillus kanasensis]